MVLQNATFSMYFIDKGGNAPYFILLQRNKLLCPLLAIAFPIANIGTRLCGEGEGQAEFA